MHLYYRESKISKGHVVFANSNVKRWLVYIDSLLNTVTPFQLPSETDNLDYYGG